MNASVVEHVNLNALYLASVQQMVNMKLTQTNVSIAAHAQAFALLALLTLNNSV
jgi:hypothetical protein